MTGLLAANGIRVSEQRFGKSLKSVNHNYHSARMKMTARQFNPNFGYKVHIDQNEKLVMYGVNMFVQLMVRMAK